MAVRPIAPMLPTSAGALPEGDDWSNEVKWDGYRALAIKNGAAARLSSRNQIGLEGVVAKRRSSIYLLGRRSDGWVKVKFNRRQEFVVGGFKPNATSHWGEGISEEDMTKLRWVEPRQMVEVSFVEWTRDDHLRHAQFVGLRDDKAPRDVSREP